MQIFFTPLKHLSFRHCCAGFLLVIILLFSGFASAQSKYASIIIEAKNGRILHNANANNRNYPASLTKMMTLYLIFSALRRGDITMKTKWKVSRRASRQPPSKLGLRPGSRISVKTAILALTIKSANDVAVVAAENLGGSEKKFARLMNRQAKKLKMKRTTFKNASGLPNKRQKSTASDLARLAMALLRDFPKYYHFFSQQSFKYHNRTYRNHNKLLIRYKGTDGIKTGYIRASGYNLVASTVRDGKRLIGVVMGGKSSKSRNKHMVSLMDKAFAKLQEEKRFFEIYKAKRKVSTTSIGKKKGNQPLSKNTYSYTYHNHTQNDLHIPLPNS
jgi:D-alanyl-D-alanine carboxypeptidase